MEISFPGMFGASDHKFECSRTIDGSETIAIVKTLSSLTRFFPFRNIPAAIPGKTFLLLHACHPWSPQRGGPPPATPTSW